MGNFYVNLAVKDADPDGLVRAFEAVNDKGFIIPSGEWTLICSELLDTQDPEIVEAYGVPLSERLDGPVVAVTNHDDDVLSIEVFTGGHRTGHYNSCPGYFAEDPGPEELRPAFLEIDGFLSLGQDVTIDSLTKALISAEGFVFALYAHEAAAKLFGLPPLSVGLGYRYVARGEFALPDMTQAFGGAALPPSGR